MSSQRMQTAFTLIKARERTGLILYVTTGFPDVATTLELVPALVDAGADIVELGVPFSDPLADGATIQRASFRALEQGMTPGRCLDVCARLRTGGVTVPLVLMGYSNPILAMGVRGFCEHAEACGVDGLIVPDLPPEEAGALRRAAADRNIDLISLLAPTSADERIAAACAQASGFVYCVSVSGVTGAREGLSDAAAGLVRRVRRYTGLPIAVGFGISRREHLEAVGEYADAAVVGSALLDVIDEAPGGRVVEEATRFVRNLFGQEDQIGRGVP